MKILVKSWLLNGIVIILSIIIFNVNVYAFVVSDIKVHGLQRVSVGTVLNYLPVQVGEDLEPTATAEIIRALYDTGFFQSVSLEKQGNVLIVNVTERATIGAIDISGNQDIPTDKLQELLKEMGLIKGRVFQSSALERLEKELKQAYNARGKYNSSIATKISELTENRVAIHIIISEGRVSRIKDIKFIGNHAFSDDELLSQFTLSKRGLLTYFTKKDQYSKTEMDASLEALRTFYFDRGYLKFNIVSSQVMLSPDKKDVYINIHINESAQYKFAGYAVVGKTILSKNKIDAQIQVKKDDVFSRKKVTDSISALGLALGDLGYGFPAINAEPRIDEQQKTVFITFVVEPGRHIYVRHINFHGNTKTADYVLRGFIRQNEGGLLSLHNIKESERQLRLLEYLKEINIKTTPVPGANNQVDLDVNLEEGPSAEATAQAGYGSNGVTFNAAINQKNFMGTGKTVGLGFNASYWGQDYNFNYYNPLYTTTGIGRGLNIYYQTQDPHKIDVSRYSLNRFGGDINYSIPFGEKSNVQLGYGYQDLNINKPGKVLQVENFVTLYDKHFQHVHLSGGWGRNSYDQLPYPNKGINQHTNFVIALPVTPNSLSYYKAAYQAHWYQPLVYDFIFNLLGNIAYGNQFDNQGLPFYENYVAGGMAQPGQVRGYDSFSLGPKDNAGNALGGNLLINGSVGMILPYPFSREVVRTSLFVDVGNVFARSLPIELRGSDSGPLRYAAGVGIEWRSPFGPLAFSVAKPLNLQPFDRQNMFQFAVSSGF